MSKKRNNLKGGEISREDFVKDIKKQVEEHRVQRREDFLNKVKQEKLIEDILKIVEDKFVTNEKMEEMLKIMEGKFVKKDEDDDETEFFDALSGPNGGNKRKNKKRTNKKRKNK